MSVLIECVPNFSEGRDSAVLNAIQCAVEAVTGVQLLDVDPGVATNRTVFTFVGAPEAVKEAAFQAIACAQQLIDMRSHTGEHPRMGATDVCPFVPVQGCTLEECAQWARELGERVGNELGIPVFLYEAAAAAPHRKRLPDLRKGEYEALEGKLSDPNWGPDVGPTEWSEAVAKSGGTVIGARPFLIAWNINLSTNNQRKADKIAAQLREKGIYARDERGELSKGEDGKPYRVPGLFKSVNAIGWIIEEYGCAQISVNLLDYTVSSIHAVYDAARRLALEEGVVVTGSELVGLIPQQALIDAGLHYLHQAGESTAKPISEIVDVAIRALGLSDLKPFDADASIVERQIQQDGPLVSLTTRGFSELLSSDAPAPGGGSVAALCGSLSVGLTAMVAQLSTKITKNSWPFGQPRPADWEAFDTAGHRAQQLRERFLHAIDADTAAFDALMAAGRLPKGSPERFQAMRAAMRQAIETPLSVLEMSIEAMQLAEVAMTGNPNARSDAGVAVSTARACAEGAWMNVRINLSGMRDQARKAQYAEKADSLLADAKDLSGRLLSEIEEFLK
ncbi:MAG: glutamate formimidoyltransferase [Myxococcota bacterium]